MSELDKLLNLVNAKSPSEFRGYTLLKEKIESALKLQDLLKGDIERLTKINPRNMIDQTILEYTMVTVEESEK